jgi:RND family efflux transporter MFP subunit
MSGKRRCCAHTIVSATIAGASSLAGCGGGNVYAPPPAPEVVVANPVVREVTTYLEYTGHTASVEAAEIRARVQGVLQAIHFTPGSNVQKGDLLFVIEPELYEARVAQAQANVQSARAQLQAAEEQLAITEEIFRRKAGSKADLVQRTQARDEALAALAQAEATLTAAKLDLSYTHIYAPVTGRIDRNLVDLGNLVGASEPTLLASIVRQDPMYAYFEVSERDALDYRQRVRSGEIASSTDGSPRFFEAEMALINETGFPHRGTIDYMSNKLNPSTGTFEVRAVFPNPGGVLLPGLFVRVRVPLTRGPQMLLPDGAIGTDEAGHFVFVVDAKNTVERRHIETGPIAEGLRIVRQGIAAEDVVIVNGVQRARPGMVVSPVREGAAAATS